MSATQTAGTSVHPEETPDASKPSRLLLIDAMEAAHLRPTAIAAFRDCARHAVALELTENPGTYKIVRVTCKSKWCPACSLRRALLIADNLELAMKTRIVRLVTLTLKHRDDPLTSQLDRLFRAFRRIRNLTRWKAHVTGGAYFLELTRNALTHTWHPHLHLICEGGYYAHPDLSEDWMRASGDSHVVHITLVRNKDQIRRYVTKYITKPVGQDTYHGQAELAEAVHALAGRRLAGCFGTWQKLRLLRKPDREPAHLVGWISELRIRADDGDQLAAKLIAIYDKLPPDVLSITVTPHDLNFLPNHDISRTTPYAQRALAAPP